MCRKKKKTAKYTYYAGYILSHKASIFFGFIVLGTLYYYKS